jgi:transcriptional regulator with XRE-family HTH domain
MEKIEFNRIKVVLAEKKIRNIELATHLGVGTPAVSRWCNNKTQPDPVTFHSIAKFLDVDVRELIVSTKE